MMNRAPVLSALSAALIMMLTASAQGSAVSERLIDKGRAALADADSEAAIFLFEQAAVADPADSIAYTWIGRAWQNAENPDRAEKYYEIALSIDPANLEALQWGGETDLARDDPAAADEKLARLAETCGTCEAFGKLEEAITLYRESE